MVVLDMKRLSMNPWPLQSRSSRQSPPPFNCLLPIDIRHHRCESRTVPRQVGQLGHLPLASVMRGLQPISLHLRIDLRLCPVAIGHRYQVRSRSKPLKVRCDPLPRPPSPAHSLIRHFPFIVQVRHYPLRSQTADLSGHDPKQPMNPSAPLGDPFNRVDRPHMSTCSSMMVAKITYPISCPICSPRSSEQDGTRGETVMTPSRLPRQSLVDCSRLIGEGNVSLSQLDLQWDHLVSCKVSGQLKEPMLGKHSRTKRTLHSDRQSLNLNNGIPS